jgi:hypothetical protein
VTRGELILKLKGDGHDYLSDAKAGQMVDQAVKDLTEAHPWPYRLVTVDQAASGDLINGLGSVESVSINNSPIEDLGSYTLAQERYGDLTTSGEPRGFWVEGERVFFFPTTGPVKVRHFSFRGWTTGGLAPADDNDTPLAPERFHDAISLRAHELAFSDVDENENAASENVRYQARVEQMREALIRDRVAGPMRIRQTRAWV